MRFKSLIALVMFQATLLFAGTALAESKIFTSWGKAIRGYDPVSYFTAGKPVEGGSDFTMKWKGATWYFASKENRELFKASPERYAPQFGGYCAWGVKEGYTASTEADAWTIVNDKLYLNYSTSIQQRWSKNIPIYIATAKKNWPGIEKDLKE